MEPTVASFPERIIGAVFALLLVHGCATSNFTDQMASENFKGRWTVAYKGEKTKLNYFGYQQNNGNAWLEIERISGTGEFSIIEVRESITQYEDFQGAFSVTSHLGRGRLVDGRIETTQLEKRSFGKGIYTAKTDNRSRTYYFSSDGKYAFEGLSVEKSNRKYRYHFAGTKEPFADSKDYIATLFKPQPNYNSVHSTVEEMNEQAMAKIEEVDRQFYSDLKKSNAAAAASRAKASSKAKSKEADRERNMQILQGISGTLSAQQEAQRRIDQAKADGTAAAYKASRESTSSNSSSGSGDPCPGQCRKENCPGGADFCGCFGSRTSNPSVSNGATCGQR
jgi:hypothetical protein